MSVETNDSRLGDGLSSSQQKDANRTVQSAPLITRTRILWDNVAKVVAIHAMALAGILLAPRAAWPTWFWFFLLYICSALGITAGAHRLWTHRSYKARWPLEVLLMLFNCISVQSNILEWSLNHRVHHKYSETDADPHNARRGFFFAHMGWLMLERHPEVLRRRKETDVTDLQDNPIVSFQCRHYAAMCILFSVLMPTLVPWYFWGENIYVAFFVAFALRYALTLHQTFLVNSAAHIWGGRPYDKTINPSENTVVSVIAIGEGFHNYHHTFPYDYSTSEWGPKLNITTAFIDLCAALGLVYDRKQASQDAIDGIKKRKGSMSSTGDESRSNVRR